ncbi:MAG: SsrA-binding protein SmpB [Bacilli bacterium]|nr:SsrA-binding protein SmpB [Bacilli bacterium]
MENIKVIARNKIVHRDYEVLEELECGIVLKGTEIKSVRQGKVSVQEAYCQAKDGKFVIYNMHIAVYDHGNIFNHDEKRDRNLLAHAKEIRKWGQRVKLEGLTIVPMMIYLKDGLAKVQVGLCRGKKKYDKREDMKQEAAKKQIAKMSRR